jgi:glyoxylase-like metal-dependent hydrolase (beta-lactamase superfamily II)
MRTLTWMAGLWAALSLAAGAAPKSKLDAELARADGWVAWRAPVAAAERPTCCMAGWNRGEVFRQGCTLEAKGLRESSFGSTDGPGALPAPSHLAVYVRAERGRVREVLGVGDTCPVRAETPVTWLDASVEDGVAFLERLAREEHDDDDRGGRSLHALAQHAGKAATEALARLAFEADEDLREDAVFWLGHGRGADGLEVVRRIAREDRDPDLRGHAMFAMSQSREPARFRLLRETVAAERDAEVRRQGYLWVAQSRDPDAQAWLEAALARERDEEGVQGVVFALSELPNDRGVDALVRLAKDRHAPDRARREALFWLGQSRDPRAMQLLDEILSR